MELAMAEESAPTAESQGSLLYSVLGTWVPGCSTRWLDTKLTVLI